jgi:hypothetical protein
VDGVREREGKGRRRAKHGAVGWIVNQRSNGIFTLYTDTEDCSNQGARP